ncbi:hypothetical protein F5Y18DRAFT_176553 [Xylariaceae sp. FL1019]|nr:hypothetical protein F5Y18DRAFT_176553 [Xylariaceae sp. FL1019]
MASFRDWFSPRWPRFRSLGSRDTAPTPKQEIDKVLGGRVTKATVTKSSASTSIPVSAYSAHPEPESSDIEDAKSCIEVGEISSFQRDEEPVNRGDENGRSEAVEEDESPSDRHDDEEEPGQPSEDEAESEVENKVDAGQHDDESEDELNMTVNSLATTPRKPMPAFPDSDSEDGPDEDTDCAEDEDTTWRREQVFLNTILNARNEFTLMPITWRMHFRGIPLPDSLFYQQENAKAARPKIYARSPKCEYRGTVALRKLIEVHGRIQDLRKEQWSIRQDQESSDKRQQSRSVTSGIVSHLEKALQIAIDWAHEDGGSAKYGNQIPRNIKIIEIKDKISADEDSANKIQVEMADLAGKWRKTVPSKDGKQAPVVFAFVILRHIIFIVTLDASNPEADIHIPCQLNMAERNQHQWNALAIMVTVCWARDVLLDYIDSAHELQPQQKSDSSDPDA